MISKKFWKNAMKIPSKQAIVEIASISRSQDILYSYVVIENDHTVDASFWPVFNIIPHFRNLKKCITDGRTDQPTNGAMDWQTLLQRCEETSKDENTYLMPSWRPIGRMDLVPPKREKERKRGSEQRDRQTDRQIEGQTDRQIEQGQQKCSWGQW